VESQPISFARTGNRWSAEGRANITDMSTANAKRDKSMFAMFSATAFPSIHGSVSNAPVPVTGATNVTMQLRIRDKEQSVTVSITGWRETNGVVQFHGATKVSLKDFGLTPPSVLGIIRVGDTVTLEADVTAGGTP
jgi:polyisoprenoid-binding protein YceI